MRVGGQSLQMPINCSPAQRSCIAVRLLFGNELFQPRA